MQNIVLDYQILPIMLALAFFGFTILGVSIVLESIRNYWRALKSYRKTTRRTA